MISISAVMCIVLGIMPLLAPLIGLTERFVYSGIIYFAVISTTLALLFALCTVPFITGKYLHRISCINWQNTYAEPPFLNFLKPFLFFGIFSFSLYSYFAGDSDYLLLRTTSESLKLQPIIVLAIFFYLPSALSCRSTAFMLLCSLLFSGVFLQSKILLFFALVLLSIVCPTFLLFSVKMLNRRLASLKLKKSFFPFLFLFSSAIFLLYQLFERISIRANTLDIIHLYFSSFSNLELLDSRSHHVICNFPVLSKFICGTFPVPAAISVTSSNTLAPFSWAVQSNSYIGVLIVVSAYLLPIYVLLFIRIKNYTNLPFFLFFYLISLSRLSYGPFLDSTVSLLYVFAFCSLFFVLPGVPSVRR